MKILPAKDLHMHRWLLAVVVAMAGCQSPGEGGVASPSSQRHEAAIPGDHVLRVGQSLALPDGSTLTYTRLAADSRCRPDVQCIRAGDADIELQWKPAAGNAQVQLLNSDPRNLQGAAHSARLGDWQVTLKALDWHEPPVATLTVARAE